MRAGTGHSPCLDRPPPGFDHARVHDESRLISSTRVVSALTLLSRILGLIRDALCSHFFGAGAVYSAFAIAFQIPNLFRRLFGEGALSAASIPVFSTLLEKQGRAAACRFASRLLTLLLVVLAGLAVLGEIIVLSLAAILPEGERTSLTLLLTAIMLPYLILICTIGVMAGLLNVLDSFGLPAMAPIIMNVCMISAVLLGGYAWPGADPRAVLALAFSVLVSGLIQLAWQWRGLASRELPVRPALARGDAHVRRVLRALAPMAIGLAAVQINTLADTLIAAACVPNPGAPAVLFYAQRLYQFPLGVFAIAYAVVLFPALSAQAAREELDQYRRTLAAGVRTIMFVGLPCSAGLMLVAGPAIRLLFEHGEFTGADTRRVTWTLLAYASGVWAYGLLHILVRAFYALQDTVRPTISSALTVVLNLALNLTLVWWLYEAGLGLATAICAAVQCAYLAAVLSRRIAGIDWRGIAGSVGKTAAATAVMCVAVLAVDRLLPALASPRVDALLRLAVRMATGTAAYALAARLLGSAELRVLGRRRHVA